MKATRDEYGCGASSFTRNLLVSTYNMDRLVDEMIRNCLPCQAVSNKTTPDPIKISPLPKAVWSDISLDLWIFSLRRLFHGN